MTVTTARPRAAAHAMSQLRIGVGSHMRMSFQMTAVPQQDEAGRSHLPSPPDCNATVAGIPSTMSEDERLIEDAQRSRRETEEVRDGGEPEDAPAQPRTPEHSAGEPWA